MSVEEKFRRTDKWYKEWSRTERFDKFLVRHGIVSSETEERLTLLWNGDRECRNLYHTIVDDFWNKQKQLYEMDKSTKTI